MTKERAKLKWEEWGRLRGEASAIRTHKYDLEKDLKLKDHLVRQIEKVWDACDEHEYDSKYCHKCGFPEF